MLPLRRHVFCAKRAGYTSTNKKQIYVLSFHRRRNSNARIFFRALEREIPSSFVFSKDVNRHFADERDIA